METIKIFGLQRSGTNYLSYLLNEYFDVQVLINIGGWKHGPYQHAIFAREINIITIVKNPYSWLRSVYEYWLQSNLGPDLENVSFKEFITSRATFESIVHFTGPRQASIPYLFRASNPVQYWNNMNFHWSSIALLNKRTCVVSYESLLLHTENDLSDISNLLQIERNLKKVEFPKYDFEPAAEKPAMSDKRWKKKTYYKDKRYLKHYTPELLEFINGEVDMELMELFKYDLES